MINSKAEAAVCSNSAQNTAGRHAQRTQNGLTWHITTEGGVGARQPPFALQLIGLAPEVQACILVLQGCNVVAVR